MGFFDDVTCEFPLPDDRDVVGRAFQTKSLWRAMDRFTITATGRRIFHQQQFLPVNGTGPQALPVQLADVDLEYHGDLELYGVDTRDSLVRCAVRFTHRTVERGRPLDDLPVLHREWLLPSRW